MASSRAAQRPDSASRRQVTPRAPSRATSLARYAALVDAVEALLQDDTPDGIGLYQIAERAGVPPASAYHFFPTKEAAFLALARRYLEGFAELLSHPVPIEHLLSWQRLTAWDVKRGTAFFNANPPASKLFLGGFGGLETRQADRDYVEATATAAYERMDSIFHMPFIRDPQKKFHINIQIVDAVLSASYVKNGEVTPDYCEEAITASIAYCRTFMPEHLEIRADVQALIDRGETAIARSSSPRSAQ